MTNVVHMLNEKNSFDREVIEITRDLFTLLTFEGKSGEEGDFLTSPLRNGLGGGCFDLEVVTQEEGERAR